jgi:coenzyme F420-reducing hydrogenase alpha subunit
MKILSKEDFSEFVNSLVNDESLNVIHPTNQNHANIELDMKALVPKLLDKKQKEIELSLEMLVRAYDRAFRVLPTT